MAKKNTPRKRIILRKISTVCLFCEQKITPSYKDPDTLAKFLSDRAKIYERARSGVCAKHQRGLAREIKRARHLGLLPFVGSI